MSRMKKPRRRLCADVAVHGTLRQVARLYHDRKAPIIPSGIEGQIIAASREQLGSVDSLVAVACGADKAVAVLGALRTGLISAPFIAQSPAGQFIVGISAGKTSR
jgi:DNA-binding transcriptional regulator LsrR (DeoR family)